MEEIWKDIIGFETKYQISNYGRVRSLPYKTASRGVKGQIISPMVDKDGYEKYLLRKPPIKKKIFCHRLVAEAFIPNPNNYPQVNHIDGNKRNNHVSNLEWCTPSMNTQHAWNTGLQNNDKRKKPIVAYKADGTIFKIFDSTSKAKEFFNVKGGDISNIANHKYGYKSHKGFTFEYLN